MKNKDLAPTYRPIIRGKALWRALGFSTERAFQRARQLKKLDLRLYPNPDNRGVHAYLEDVENYLAKQAISQQAQGAPKEGPMKDP